MKQRLSIFCLLWFVFSCSVNYMQGSVFKTKQPKQNAQQIKMELAESLQKLLSQATESIRHITGLIDDIVLRGKELSGQQDGPLATTEKESLKAYQKKVTELLATLQCLEGQLTLS